MAPTKENLRSLRPVSAAHESGVSARLPRSIELPRLRSGVLGRPDFLEKMLRNPRGRREALPLGGCTSSTDCLRTGAETDGWIALGRTIFSCTWESLRKCCSNTMENWPYIANRRSRDRVWCCWGDVKPLKVNVPPTSRGESKPVELRVSLGLSSIRYKTNPRGGLVQIRYSIRRYSSQSARCLGYSRC